MKTELANATGIVISILYYCCICVFKCHSTQMSKLKWWKADKRKLHIHILETKKCTRL